MLVSDKLKAAAFAAILTLLFTLQAYAQPTGQGTQGPIQYSPNCGISLRYGSMAVCYDTTLQSWYYWSYQARGGKGAFVPSSISTNEINYLSYGVCDGGVTDQNPSAAGPLQTAINAAALQAGPTGTGTLLIPATCNASAGHQLVFSTGVTIPDNVVIKGLAGSTKASTTVGVELDYTGSGVAMTSTSTHGVRLIDFRLKNTGSGTDGIDLNGTFSAVLEGLDVHGFSSNGFHLLVGGSSSIYNTIRDSSAESNGTDLFLDGTGAAPKAVGGNSFYDDQFVASTGTSNVVLTSFASNPNSAGYDNVYQNYFHNVDVSNGNGAATVGFTSNASLNITLVDVIAESLNAIYALNAGTVNWQVLGSEAAVASTSATGPISADGAASYNICWDFLGGIGTPECDAQGVTQRNSYIEPTNLQEATGQVGIGQLTNLMTYSEDFSQAAWVNSGITSVTPNAVAAPNGQTAASSLVVTPGGASFVQQTFSIGSSIANQCYTGSVWARTATGTARMTQLLSDAGGITDGGLNTAFLTTSWKQYSVTGCASGSDSSTAITYRPLYFPSNAPTVTVYLWGAQLAKANEPIAYVKTAASTITTTQVGSINPSFVTGLTPGISGGGSLATGSNSFSGTITASAATGNVLTPGRTCPNTTICILSDETTLGGAKVTASSATSCTFSATASDTVDYQASCR